MHSKALELAKEIAKVQAVMPATRQPVKTIEIHDARNVKFDLNQVERVEIIEAPAVFQDPDSQDPPLEWTIVHLKGGVQLTLSRDCRLLFELT